jgi:hypothetical protein
VVVSVVVTVDEGGHECSCVTDAAEAFREHGRELESLEPGLAVIPNSG